MTDKEKQERPERLSEAFRRKSLECFWYLTHVENLASILEHGILSYKLVQEMELLHQSIANPAVRARRTPLPNGVDLHECVALYMAWNNPMLWAVKNHPLAYIPVSLDVADSEGILFSDGNAAAGNVWDQKPKTWFFEKVTDIERLPWNVILDERWTGEEEKRKRCAEFLVPEVVQRKFLLRPVRCNRPVESLAVPDQVRDLLQCDQDLLKISQIKQKPPSKTLILEY